MLDLHRLDLDEIATALSDQADPDLVQVWRFSDARAKRRAVEWLLDQRLVDDTAAQRFLADHPNPALP